MWGKRDDRQQIPPHGGREKILMAPEPIPDYPVAFGYKQQWLAVRDRDSQALADALGWEDTKPSTWREGIGRAYDRYRRRAGERLAKNEIAAPVEDG
jgi:hypothetical protein